MVDKVLTLYVIYDHPLDYPDKWVVRPQIVLRRPGTGGSEVSAQEVVEFGRAMGADSLEEARLLIPPGLANIGRMANDDPKIHEVWI